MTSAKLSQTGLEVVEASDKPERPMRTVETADPPKSEDSPDPAKSADFTDSVESAPEQKEGD